MPGTSFLVSPEGVEQQRIHSEEFQKSLGEEMAGQRQQQSLDMQNQRESEREADADKRAEDSNVRILQVNAANHKQEMDAIESRTGAQNALEVMKQHFTQLGAEKKTYDDQVKDINSRVNSSPPTLTQEQAQPYLEKLGKAYDQTRSNLDQYSAKYLSLKPEDQIKESFDWSGAPTSIVQSFDNPVAQQEYDAKMKETNARIAHIKAGTDMIEAKLPDADPNARKALGDFRDSHAAYIYALNNLNAVKSNSFTAGNKNGEVDKAQSLYALAKDKYNSQSQILQGYATDPAQHYGKSFYDAVTGLQSGYQAEDSAEGGSLNMSGQSTPQQPGTLNMQGNDDSQPARIGDPLSPLQSGTSTLQTQPKF